MEEFGDRTSEKYTEKIEDVDCPFCGKAKIRATFIPGYMSWNTSRIAAGAKRTRYFHDPKITVRGKCPECGKSSEEIKEALESGGKIKTHEERLKRLQESGLPTKIVAKKQEYDEIILKTGRRRAGNHLKTRNLSTRMATVAIARTSMLNIFSESGAGKRNMPVMLLPDVWFPVWLASPVAFMET